MALCAPNTPAVHSGGLCSTGTLAEVARRALYPHRTHDTQFWPVGCCAAPDSCASCVQHHGAAESCCLQGLLAAASYCLCCCCCCCRPQVSFTPSESSLAFLLGTGKTACHMVQHTSLQQWHVQHMFFVTLIIVKNRSAMIRQWLCSTCTCGHAVVIQ